MDSEISSMDRGVVIESLIIGWYRISIVTLRHEPSSSRDIRRSLRGPEIVYKLPPNTTDWSICCVRWLLFLTSSLEVQLRSLVRG